MDKRIGDGDHEHVSAVRPPGMHAEKNGKEEGVRRTTKTRNFFFSQDFPNKGMVLGSQYSSIILSRALKMPNNAPGHHLTPPSVAVGCTMMDDPTDH